MQDINSKIINQKLKFDIQFKLENKNKTEIEMNYRTNNSFKNSPLKFDSIHTKYNMYSIDNSIKHVKSTSLPNSLQFNKNRLDDIYSMYKSKSNSKFVMKRIQKSPKNLSYNKQPLKLLTFAQNYDTVKKTKRLSINQNSTSQIKIVGNIMLISQKLETIYSTISDKIFLSLYEKFDNHIRQCETDPNNIYRVLRLMNNCHKRKCMIIEKQFKKKVEKAQDKNLFLQSEINKYQIKIKTLNLKLENQNKRIKQFMKEMTKLKNRPSNSIGTNTQNNNQNTQTQTINSFDKNDKKLKDKINLHKKKQQELIGVLCLLRSEGVNVQKAYQTIIEQQLSNICTENHSQQLSFAKINKKNQKTRIIISNKFDNDADQSFVSSVQAMSFNYETKEHEEDIFLPRYQFKDSKQLNSQMKNMLKININCSLQSSINEFCQDSQMKTV